MSEVDETPPSVYLLFKRQLFSVFVTDLFSWLIMMKRIEISRKKVFASPCLECENIIPGVYLLLVYTFS